MKLSIIRHADPDYKNNTITAEGHLEAEALAKKFQNIKCDRIYSSPINRAVHTMEYTAQLLNIEPMIEPWTREISCSTVDEHGNPLAAWNIPGEQVRRAYPVTDQQTYLSQEPYQNFTAVFEQIRNDSDDFLRRHGYERENGAYRLVQPNHEHILVFCHLGFGLTWIAQLLELPIPLIWSGFFLPPSSVTTIVFEERSDEWAVPRCIGLGDVSHLHVAGLAPSTSGLHLNNFQSIS